MKESLIALYSYLIGALVGLIIGFIFAREALMGQKKYYEEKLDALVATGEGGDNE